MTPARTFRDAMPLGSPPRSPRLRSVPGVSDQPRPGQNRVSSGTGSDPLPPREEDWPDGALILPHLAVSLMTATAAAAACASALLLLLGGAVGNLAAAWLVAPWLLLVVAALLARRASPARQWLAVTGTAVATALLVAVSVGVLNWGLGSPLLSLLGMLVCAVCALAGWRSGLFVATAALFGLAGLAWWAWAATAASSLRQPLSPLGVQVGVQVGVQLGVLLVGLACGALLSRTMVRTQRAARERELRLGSLLKQVADVQWEIDQEYRLVAVTSKNPRFRPMNFADGLGSIPWTMPPFGCDAAVLDELLADLEGRHAFRERPITWTATSGRSRKLLISGEPRFDQRGVFTGFWGITRDTTDITETRAELQATEARYQELFSRIPTPLVLHRELLVLDANPAAAQLFGYKDAQEMLGCDVLAAFEDADNRKRARERMDTLVQRPLGSALPVNDFKLRVQGRRLAVRATGVRVEAVGGPAVLSIFVDDTERLAAEDSVHRSEALQSHLLATSPDLIMLVDASTSRLVKVNPAFQRMMGASEQDVLGRTTTELKLWADSALEQRIAQELLNTGTLTDQAVVLQAQSGQALPVRLSAARLAMHDCDYLVFTARDMSESERARHEAEAASRAKSAFLANTSHELRTPLNGLIGLARLARDPQTTEEQRRGYLDQISESAHALASIISDILDVSKIEAGKLTLESTAFDLGKLLQALQAHFTPLAQAQKLELQFDIEAAALGAVIGDPVRVRQIISNFIANAIKFTPTGRVRVRVQRPGSGSTEAAEAAAAGSSDWVRVEVHDTGPGIPRETQAQLFRPFTQGDQSTTRRFGGTGLGLSINRELAMLMGGEVGVVSELGQGCVFWAQLPLPPGRPVAAPAPRAHADGLQGMHVLMVEDNPVNMLIAVALLERWGVQVTQAHNGQEAVEAVQATAAHGGAFDAVLMDVQMPVMSGHEATRALRQSEAGRDLPIIALTAAALVSEREEALRAGMNDFLTKPIDAEKLRSTLRRCCATLH